MRHHEIKTSVAAIVMAAGLVGGVFTQAELDHQKMFDGTLRDDGDTDRPFLGDRKPAVWVGNYTQIFDLMRDMDDRMATDNIERVILIPVLEESRLRYRMIFGVADDYISDEEMLTNREYITWLADELRSDYQIAAVLNDDDGNDCFMSFYDWLSFFSADFRRLEAVSGN